VSLCVAILQYQTFLFHLVNQPPLQRGVIIRNGAKISEGKYTGNNLSSQLNNNSDFELQKKAIAQDKTFPLYVAYLEFDFVPLSNKFSFDFYLLLMSMFNVAQ
jgi:hypothetical protein